MNRQDTNQPPAVPPNQTEPNWQPSDQFVSNNQLSLDLTYILNGPDGQPFLSESEIESLAPRVIECRQQLANREGDCLDNGTVMLGWQSLPDQLTKEHLDKIVSLAQDLSAQIDAFVSVGIGGSYLGIEATVKALTHTWFNQLDEQDRGGAPEIYFLGQNTDPDFFHDTLDVLKGQRLGLNVISKSGTTTETAIAFRILRQLLEQDNSSEAAKRIVATTGDSGALRELTEQKGYHSLVVPDEVGGRFSVLTDVGLFGLAMAGIDIYEFAAGFKSMKHQTDSLDFWSNLAMVHTAVRHLAHQKGKRIEVVASNSMALYQVTRWMEQLFPESEGQNGHGMWVSPSMYSEKLHANGQMVQQGHRNLLETFLQLDEANHSVPIPGDPGNMDGLNYLTDAGLGMNHVNRLVVDGPAYAHFQGGVPNMTIHIPRRNAFNLGQFYYWMELSVALSGYLAGHNPFVQPGVQAYKEAMFGLAGKPGYEQGGIEIRKAMQGFKKRVIP